MADKDTLFSLTPEDAHIWIIDISDIDSFMNSYEALLSEDERDRANSYKFQKDKNEYIVCRAVLRKLLAEYLNVNPLAIEFEYSEFGKPYLKHESLIKFNLSHSGDFAVIGLVEKHAIGIDIELLKKDFDVVEIAKNFFSEQEVSVLSSLPENLKSQGFYRCWTRKEAFIKAEGSGLSFPLDSFTVSFDSDERAALLETKWDPNELKNWVLHSFVPAQGYHAALAIKGSINAVVINEWKHRH